jgi:hypothetical protein
VEEIDVVYIDQHPPTAAFKTLAPPPLAPVFRPTTPKVEVLPFLGEARPFGDCEVVVASRAGQRFFTMRQPRPTGSGVVLPLQHEGKALDVLSYATLYLQGETSAPLTLALADTVAQQRQDNVPLTTLTGRFDLRVSLSQAARQLDLRHLAALVLLPTVHESQIRLDTIMLERTTEQRQAPPKRGFWIWDYRQALAAPEDILHACQRYGCQRLLLQMPALAEGEAIWQSYRQFFSLVHSRGIEAFALDGYPEAIHDPEALAGKVQRLLAAMPNTALAGVQLDVEPYLLPDFFLDPQGYKKYLTVLEYVRTALAGQARLSVVMPFWFTTQWLDGRPVAFAVMDRADEVAVMSYRTALDEVRAIAEDTLRYGTMVRLPVWLAVETRALPVERHVTLRREARREFADAYLDSTRQRLVLQVPPAETGLTWFRVQHRMTVRPERLTFAGQTRHAVETTMRAMQETLPDASLAGILIHDLDGFQALPD